MRRLLLAILTPAIFSLYLSAETERTVSLSFSPEVFSLTEEDSLTRITTSAYNMILKNDTLSPCLPYVCVYVLIGSDEEYLSSSVQTSRTVFQENVRLAPNPLPVPTDFISDAPPLPGIHFNESSYPDNNVEYTGTHTIDGFRVLSFLVCPFIYDNISNKLFFCHQMDLGLQLGHDNDKRKETSVTTNADIIKKIKEYVVNPGHMDMLYMNVHDKEQNRSNSEIPTIDDAPCNYLIITCDSLKNEFQRLANWKIARGLKTEILTVEDIYQNYTDRNNPLKIKHAIKDYYTSSSNALKYVLLGGGKEIVPVQNCYATFGGEETTAPSDLFYACVQDLEWDTNGNGKYGELGDNVSLYPNFALGRLPASDVSQERMMVDRILKYEMNPDTTGWKSEMLMCAACDTTLCTYNGESVSWFHAESERLYDTYVNNPLWSVSKYRFYDTGTDNGLGAGYNVTADNLQVELSKGYSFVNVLTHGIYFSWQMETGRGYMHSDASSLYNTHHSFVVTQACHTNNISFTQSLGNEFMQNPHSGIIGYWGSTDYAYGAAYGQLGAVDIVTGSMYNSLFSVERHIGSAIMEAQRSRLSNYQSNSEYRWNHLFLMALTDPSMCIYTTKPQSFSQTQISHRGDTISVDLGTPGFYACAMSRHDNGSTYWNSLGSNGGCFSFNNLPGESMICAWYPDYMPLRIIFAPEVRLQNESLSDNINVTADRVLIGSNVASDRDNGSVIVENGKSIISYTQEVVIENDFEVKSGASLEISISQ